MLNKYQESMAIARDCDHPSVTITFTANSLTSRKEIGAKLYKLLKAEHRDPVRTRGKLADGPVAVEQPDFTAQEVQAVHDDC